MITTATQKEKIDFIDKIKEIFIPKDKSITDKLPYKKSTKDGLLKTKNNTYQGILKVKTTDLTSISEDNFYRMVEKLTYLNRVYLEPFKIIALTYPTEVVEQISYWNYRINSAKRDILNNTNPNSEMYLQWNLKLAMDNYSRIEFVSSLPELTFGIIVYGDTVKEVKNRISVMAKAGGREFELEQLGQKEVDNVVAKLMNMNSSL